MREEPFEYSRFPGAWATPAGGLAGGLTVIAGALIGGRASASAALTVLVGGALLLAAGGWWVARRGVLDLPWTRAQGVNLLAWRGTGGAEPRVWLVAHLDSKSQPVPMLLRVAGVTGLALAWLSLIAVAAVALLGGPLWSAAWTPLGAAGAIAALPVIASVVDASSPGAVDDASGVATVLLATERLSHELPIGVALTSAEELGMAGARALARGRAAAIALNVDGVDDRGSPLCMRHAGGPRAIAGVRRAAAALGMHVRVRPTIPGVLTDGVALADAGWSAVTLSRGTLATLARVHRRADNLDALRGDGVEEMARLLAAAAREIA